MNPAALILALLVVPAADAELTILDFHSQGCAPCRLMRPEIRRLVERKYPVQSIDVQDDPKLAARYQIQEVPTFVIVDSKGRALARSKGFQPAKELAVLYNHVLEDVAVAPTREVVDDAPAASDEDDLVEADDAINPEPWKTVVRLRIDDPYSKKVGFGSGTVIDSNAEEALVLTCAHLFKIDGVREQYPPSRFPLRIIVDLFDGVGRGRNMTPMKAQEVVGKVIDYDFSADVALVKIRPGRRLPSSKVVGLDWKPRKGLKLTAVGCSHGHDPTAWTTTILNPAAPGPDPNYRGMECVHAPKQGRSGGGIFTPEGYVAGVCDFASFTNTGLYARPESIHRLLDKNRLTALYNPAGGRGDTLLAQKARDRDRAAVPASIAARKDATTGTDRSEPSAVRNPDQPISKIRTHADGAPAWQAAATARSSEREPEADDSLDPRDAPRAPVRAYASGPDPFGDEGPAAPRNGSDDFDDPQPRPRPKATNDRASSGSTAGWRAPQPMSGTTSPAGR